MMAGAIALYEEALRESAAVLFLRTADGRALPLQMSRWCGRPDAADEELLRHCRGPVLDVGCGPGRLTVALTERGIPALGVHVVRLAGEFPNARVILAHAGITDLSWIWRAASDLPNLLFDTSWWMPADLLALFSLVPPGQIVFASDAPYGHTLASASSQLRLALQAGLSPEQVKLLASGQSLRLARGESLAPGGPAIGEREHASHLLLDRLAEFLLLGTIMTFRGGDGSEMLSLARLACEVPDEVDDAPVFDAIRRLLWIYDEITRMEPENRRRLVFLMMAITVAKTPDVPIPR